MTEVKKLEKLEKLGKLEKLTKVSHPMNNRTHSPERAFRPQAGVKPLQKASDSISPERAAEHTVTPLGVGLHPPVYRGFTPACSLIRPSAFRVGNFN